MLDKDMFPDLRDLPEARVHASHPFKSKKNHEKLLKYLIKRLEFADQMRQAMIPKFEQIDIDVSAYHVLSEDDKDRRRDQLDGKSVKPVHQVLPLVMTHLDDAMTYFMQVFAPESGIYKAVASKDKQAIASAFAALMNDHATERGHLRQLLMFFLNCMKYNLGSVSTEWIQQVGNEVVNAANNPNQPDIQEGIIWQGNELRCGDMYNVMWDPSVHPADCHVKGEFCAEILPLTPFRLYKMGMEGTLFNLEEFFSDDFATQPTRKRFYHEPPDLSNQYMGFASGGTDSGASGMNWMSILSEGRVTDLGTGLELVNVMIHINPKQFGLLPPKQARDFKGLQTWRISILNGTWIVKATRLTNAHGRLPMNFASPLEDKELALNQKSVAEILAPLQTFGSFVINTHVSATRKNIWDMIVYDPSVIDFSSVKEGDSAWRVPMRPEGYGQDINKAIWQNSNRPDTENTMQQLEQLINFMQLIWPTSSGANQIASIERAVESQVANTVIGQNRRLFKAAKLIDDQALRPSRHMQHFNILQFQPEITLLTDSGEEIEIQPSQFRGENLRLTLGHGLAALDQFTIQQQIQRLVNSIIQSQAASEQFDLPGLLDSLSELMDIRIDLSQHRRQVEPPPGQPAGAQGAESAGGQSTGGAV